MKTYYKMPKKAERHQLYKNTLAYIEEYTMGSGFFCLAVCYFADIQLDMKKAFPELWKLRRNDFTVSKGEESGNYSWFTSRPQRIKAIRKCIRETKPKKKV